MAGVIFAPSFFPPLAVPAVAFREGWDGEGLREGCIIILKCSKE